MNAAISVGAWLATAAVVFRYLRREAIKTVPHAPWAAAVTSLLWPLAVVMAFAKALHGVLGGGQ